MDDRGAELVPVFADEPDEVGLAIATVEVHWEVVLLSPVEMDGEASGCVTLVVFRRRSIRGGRSRGRIRLRRPLCP